MAGTAHTELFTLADIVLGVSLAADGISLIRAIVPSWRQVAVGAGRVGRAFRMARDPALSTVLAEDPTAVVGLLIAAAGLGLHQATDDGRREGVASILIALILEYAAVRLGRRSEALIIGQAADPSSSATRT